MQSVYSTALVDWAIYYEDPILKHHELPPMTNIASMGGRVLTPLQRCSHYILQPQTKKAAVRHYDYIYIYIYMTIMQSNQFLVSLFNGTSTIVVYLMLKSFF